jgi:hypothetical protein
VSETIDGDQIRSLMMVKSAFGWPRMVMGKSEVGVGLVEGIGSGMSNSGGGLSSTAPIPRS